MRTKGYFPVTEFQSGFETQEDAIEAGRKVIKRDPTQHISIIYVQLVSVLEPEPDNNPFQLTTQGTIENSAPLEESQLAETRKMLDQAAGLVSRTQLELKACRNRLMEQEGELQALREELNKPMGE